MVGGSRWVLAAVLFGTAAGAASAADLPRRHHHRWHEPVAYVPRGGALVAVAPRYRVIYQDPSFECAENDFCAAAL